ncbi:MAG: U32 family peptidase [Candidatus Lokiarchaeota archaeon]|nr:U32 family peptidase [Candidatus Lokiarchaeota archaeon]MCK4481199.1 U32 family peptidase [Candidatus Lokiarchaeota archaeon]
MISIKLHVATNWDLNLIDELAQYPVSDLFGVSDHSIVGGGRPSFLLKKVSEEDIAEYVRKLHEKKMEFSYLLNAPCMNNMEYDQHYHKELLKYLQWISDIGADSVTVTIPFLIQLIKEQFPKLKIRVSTIAHVNSVNRAMFYEMLGADEITLDVMINRDFKTLEQIQKTVKCKIIVLLTDGCLYQCPFRLYHYNTLGHASQTFQQFERNYVDTCILNCSIIKFSNPTEVLKARWVRPEDLSHYEAIGIDDFKIAGRRMSTQWIINSVKAFSSRKYEGNLIDIIQGFSMSFGGLEQKDPNVKLTETIEKESKSKLYIDNTKLNGFIDFFKKQNCVAMCNECNYCEEWANKSVLLDKEESTRYVDSIKNYMNDIITSREFGVTSSESKEKKTIGLNWNPETERIFNELIKLSPPQFQQMARMAIASLAEEKAKKRVSEIVENKDIVEAFIEGTPGPFQADMREGLKKYRLLNE